jgi:hypothetical protein
MPLNANDILLIKKRYTNLLIKQYFEKSKASQHIETLVDLFLQNGAIFYLLDTFNIEIAIGWQLDAIGERLGVDRFFIGLELSDEIYLSFGVGAVLPTTQYKGFGAGAEPGFIVSEGNVVSRAIRLNDDDFRLLLRFKAALLQSDYTEYSISNIIFNFFGLSVGVVSGNMEIIYNVQPSAARAIAILRIKNLLPKPQSVNLTINFL